MSFEVDSCVLRKRERERQKKRIVSKLYMQMRIVFLRVYHSSVRMYIHSINFNYVITLSENEVLFLKHRFQTSRHMRQWPMGKDDHYHQQQQHN
jgi:hypothetical protein